MVNTVEFAVGDNKERQWEGDYSPVAWARSNVIFSAHPKRPSVHGQIVPGTPNAPSTHHFELPLPDPVNAGPALFGPPTCIIISDDDSHLFAFFPPSCFSMSHATGMKLGGGVSCVWERTSEITSWDLLEFWRSERGNDVISGQWLDNNRKWTCTRTADSSGTPNLIHLPPSGPRTLNTPTLLLVMQREEVQLHFQSPFRNPGSLYYNHIRASLRNPSVVYETDVQTQPAVAHPPELGQRVITHAAICPIFNEHSIIIATHSVIYPLMSFGQLDEFTPHMSEIGHLTSLEDFGNCDQNLSVDVCEVSFNLHSLQRVLTTSPMFAVQLSEATLQGLPSGPDTHQDHMQLLYRSNTIRSLHIAPRLVVKPSLNSATHDTTVHLGDGCIIVAHASSVDFPTTFSHLETWTLVRNRSGPNSPSASTTTLSPPRPNNADSELQSWLIEPASRRTLPGTSMPCILTDNLVQTSFVLLNDQSTSPSEELSSGRVEGSAHDRGAGASIIRLKLADLLNDAWLGQNPVPARTIRPLNPYPSESTPTVITCAPNQTSAVVRSGLSPWHTLSIVSLLPIPSFPGVPEASSSSMMPVLAHLSVMLALSMLNANDPADLVRSFWARFTEKDVAALVRGAFDLLRPLEPQTAIITEEALGTHLAPMIGFLVGLYRAAPDPQVKQRSRTMLALCQLSACLRAFDETLGPRDAGPRFREAALMWQVSTLAGWSIGLCEDIVRDALRYHASRAWETRPNKPTQEDGMPYTLLPFVLMHQPMNLLRRVLAYVQQAQGHLEANGNNAELVSVHKQLTSMLDSSPLVLGQAISMAKALEEKALKSLYENDGTKRAVEDLLFTQMVPAALTEHLVNATSLIASHSALRDPAAKTQLLLPASDLLDIPLVVRAQTDVSFAEKDVIAKTPLTRVGGADLGFRLCVRCGSRAELRWLDRQTRGGIAARGVHWNAFANEWQEMCVCGGNWVLSR